MLFVAGIFTEYNSLAIIMTAFSLVHNSKLFQVEDGQGTRSVGMRLLYCRFYILVIVCALWLCLA